jgi:hypothetical protein
MSCNDLHLYELRAIVIGSSATFIGWVIHLGLSLWWPSGQEIKPEVPRHAVLKEDCPPDGALPDPSLPDPSHRPNASEDAGI